MARWGERRGVSPFEGTGPPLEGRGRGMDHSEGKKVIDCRGEEECHSFMRPVKSGE